MVLRITAIVFDFGNTLIHQRIDDLATLDQLDITPVEGATTALESLRGQYKIGLLSNTVTSGEVHVRKVLDSLGWRGVFDTVVTSTDVGSEKPDPTIFRYALKQLRSKPSECLMVGNDLAADIAGAARVGLRTAFYSCNPDDWMRLKDSEIRPDHVLTALSDVEKIVELVNRDLAPSQID